MRTVEGMSTHPAPQDPSPRSLSDELRGWDDEALLALLERRMDLAIPPPTDLTCLALRAAGRASVQRALDHLDTAGTQVLAVLAILPEPVDEETVSRRWGAPAGAPLARLRELALVWGPPDGLHLLRTARELAGPFPAGLGPPLTEALDRRSPQRLGELVTDLGLPPTGDPDTALRRLAEHLGEGETLAALLARAPEGAGTVLERLAWADTPVGSVPRADRDVRAGTAASPVEWLLAHGLLAVADPGHVVLPREIALALRGGRVFREPGTAPPPLLTRAVPARHVTGASVAAATELVRLVAHLGDEWGRTPPPVLRSGGLGVRELRRTATALGVDEPAATLLVEVARAAGLVADDGAADPRWAPTPAFDAWIQDSPGVRWAHLAAAWITMPRAPHLAGTRNDRGAARVALSPDLERALAPATRLAALRELATTRPPAAPDPASLLARLDWASPRLAGTARSCLLTAILTEAETLGITGAGALAPHAALLLPDAQAPEVGQQRPRGDLQGSGGARDNRPDAEPDPILAGAALDEILPPPVDHVLLQADLTAVVPGPPTPDLAAHLDLLADPESRGGAAVYRFSASSLRRGMDAGYCGEDILGILRTRSRTPVPQPLAYLVTDVARRHGRLRVGPAGAYLRADDELLLDELIRDRRAASLGLRRLAPTVLVAQAPPGQVLDTLRAMGSAPAAESPQGELVLQRPALHRAPERPVERHPGRAGVDRESLQGAVRLLRASEGGGMRVTTGNGTAPAGTAPASPDRVRHALRAAVASRRPVWLGYAGQDGEASHLLVEPLSVEGGRVSALAGGEIRVLSIHRVTAVAPADTDGSLAGGVGGGAGAGSGAPASGTLTQKEGTRTVSP